MTEADDGRWWSKLLAGRADDALDVPDAAWNSALSAAFDTAERPELDELIPDEAVAAAADWHGKPESDWPDDEHADDIDDEAFADADDGDAFDRHADDG